MATGTKGKYNKIKKDAEDGFFEAIMHLMVVRVELKSTSGMAQLGSKV